MWIDGTSAAIFAIRYLLSSRMRNVFFINNFLFQPYSSHFSQNNFVQFRHEPRFASPFAHLYCSQVNALGRESPHFSFSCRRAELKLLCPGRHPMARFPGSGRRDERLGSVYRYYTASRTIELPRQPVVGPLCDLKAKWETVPTFVKEIEEPSTSLI